MDLQQESLEAEVQLEDSRRDLKEAVQEIKQKVEIAKEQLDPARFIRQYPLAFAGAAASIGFFLGMRTRVSTGVIGPAMKSMARPTAIWFGSALGHAGMNAMVRKYVRPR